MGELGRVYGAGIRIFYTIKRQGRITQIVSSKLRSKLNMKQLRQGPASGDLGQDELKGALG